MVEEGKIMVGHAYKFEGSLIALRSDSLQIYTATRALHKGGDLYMYGWGCGGTVVMVVVVVDTRAWSRREKLWWGTRT